VSEHGAVLSESMIRALPSKVSQIAQGMLLAIGIGSTTISIAGEWSHGHHTLHTWLVDNVQIVGCTLHLILVALVLLPGRIRPLNDEVVDETVRSAIQCLNLFYVKAWTWFWVFLGWLYMTALFMALGRGSSLAVNWHGDTFAFALWPRLLSDGFNAGSTLYLLIGYSFLNPSFLRSYIQETVGVSTSKREELSRWRAWRRFWFKPTLVPIVAFLFSVGCRLTVSQQDDPTTWERYSEIMLGLSSAVAVAYLAGRLDSKFIRNWQWAIVALFLYAAMQPYASLLYSREYVHQAIFTYAAFTMKCVLFIFVSNLFENRGMIYYAVEVAESARREL
jgi:hypothetical protein